MNAPQKYAGACLVRNEPRADGDTNVASREWLSGDPQVSQLRRVEHDFDGNIKQIQFHVAHLLSSLPDT